PPRERFIGRMAFSAMAPPCMNSTLKFAGMARISRRSASACRAIEMNSLPRWLISITLMPVPRQSSISAAACRSTSSGRVAGPAAKLKGRVRVLLMKGSLRSLLRRGLGGAGGRSLLLLLLQLLLLLGFAQLAARGRVQD